MVYFHLEANPHINTAHRGRYLGTCPQQQPGAVTPAELLSALQKSMKRSWKRAVAHSSARNLWICQESELDDVCGGPPLSGFKARGAARLLHGAGTK